MSNIGDHQGALPCAECRRSELECDRICPCGPCIRRGFAELCTYRTHEASKGNNGAPMTHTKRLEVEIKMMKSKVKQLEEALSEARAGGSRRRTDIFGPSLTTPGASEDVKEAAESIGSFSIGSDGAGKYYGRFAGSESYEDKHENRLPKSLSLSSEITELAVAAPYGIKGCGYEKSIFAPYIPPYQRAVRLVELYYEKAAWMYRPILRPEFDSAILGVLYDQGGRHRLEMLHPHRISTFFIALALGSHYEQESAVGESDSETYHLLALAALSLSSIIHEVTCSALQALFLVIQYYYFIDPGTDETRWLLFGALCRAAQVIGLQRDGAPWNLDAQEVQRRRTLFWEMYTWDSWACIVMGRPGAFRLEDTDCGFPDDDGLVRADGQVEYSYHGWKFRYSSACLAPTVRFTGSLKTPEYSQLLELDRRIRTFPLPGRLQSPWNESPEGWADDPSLAMQQYGVVCERETNLMYLHRPYFVEAIRHPSRDPLGHKYSPSVLGAYRSARRLISSLRGVYAKHPQLTATIWFFWSAVFSACYILGGIVVESPGCPLAPAALTELERAITFYQEGSTTRFPYTTTMLERLRDRARVAFSRSQSGLDPQPSTESDSPDDVAIISGRTGVINRSGSSRSSDSTLRPLESSLQIPLDTSGVIVSPKTSPVVSNKAYIFVHGNMGIGDVVQGSSLGRRNPNNIPPHPPRHQQYIEDANDSNGSIGHGNEGVVSLSPPHPEIDQMHDDPRSQQLHYTTDLHHPSHQQITTLPFHGSGDREEIQMDPGTPQLRTPRGNLHTGGY